MNAKLFLVFGLTLCFAVQKSSGVDRKMGVWKFALSSIGIAVEDMSEEQLKSETVPRASFKFIFKATNPATDPVTYAAFEALAETFGVKHFELSIAQKSMDGFSGR
ncbi:uncharacterized protein LOC126837991 [Adelges cooleyi]|uniref:uncharacterized protein LOC126837991 n=1 Tax=Adelges cooleyi TaxID=133065 RepID=UPI00218080E9|nr:uncharacterized protein LOC126837991 [Adelges cooleyi]